jgi:hypothetical protein
MNAAFNVAKSLEEIKLSMLPFSQNDPSLNPEPLNPSLAGGNSSCFINVFLCVAKCLNKEWSLQQFDDKPELARICPSAYFACQPTACPA